MNNDVNITDLSNKEAVMETVSPRIIVSLTSYTKRIMYVAKSVETVLAQTKPADMVLLWLSKDEFLGQENDLPEDLIALTRRGLTIRWCEKSLKPHTKYYYTMKEYPDDLVITVDDDILYPPNMIEMLYDAHLRFPDCVCARRCHLITFTPDGKIARYNQWDRISTYLVNQPTFLQVPTGVGGVIYPPHCLHPALFNMDDIESLCLRADDLWLKIMQVMANTKTVLISENCPLYYVDNTQEVGLWKTNTIGGGNDAQMEAILSKYDAFFGEEDTLTARIRNEVPYACLMGLIQQQEAETEKLTVRIPESADQPETLLEIRRTGVSTARSISIIKTENGKKIFYPLTDAKGERAYALESDARKQQKQIEELRRQIVELQKQVQELQNKKALPEKVKRRCKMILKCITGQEKKA